MPLPIVLVPGIGDDERKVRMLAARVEKAGRRPLAIAPQPSDGTVSIETLAQLLSERIDAALGAEAPFDLFGFSMGGIVSRCYLQQMGGLARVRRFVTLATPHRGTWLAFRYPSLPAVQQMRPSSAFLTALNDEMHLLEQIAFTSLWSPLDLTIMPASSSALPVGRSLRVISPWHGTLLYDPNVLRQAMAALNGELRNAKPSPNGGAASGAA